MWNIKHSSAMGPNLMKKAVKSPIPEMGPNFFDKVEHFTEMGLIC